MNKENVTIAIDEAKCQEMISYYLSKKEDNNGEYVLFFCHINDDLTLTLFHSKKGFKAFFSGINALSEARKWNENAIINIPKQVIKTSWKDTSSQIGSDEVGTGDFFGPIIVCAAYVNESLIPSLIKLGIDDSKKLTDKKIQEIVPQIIDKITYKIYICKPIVYNSLVEQGYTLNEMKAILHNSALQNVREKISYDEKCFVDQFTSPSSYYSYLEKYNKPALRNNIIFETKGESYYPSVAVASMIARYEFLKYFEKISKKYNIEFLKGASSKVIDLALKIKEKYGLKELDSLVKKNFVNYQKLLDN